MAIRISSGYELVKGRISLRELLEWQKEDGTRNIKGGVCVELYKGRACSAARFSTWVGSKTVAKIR